MVQWLRLRAHNSGGLDSIHSQGTRSHTPQLKILRAAIKIDDLRLSTADFFFFLNKNTHCGLMGVSIKVLARDG